MTSFSQSRCFFFLKNQKNSAIRHKDVLIMGVTISRRHLGVSRFIYRLSSYIDAIFAIRIRVRAQLMKANNIMLLNYNRVQLMI